jgi:hypothetical protein
MEMELKKLTEAIEELSRRIGATGFNNYLNKETTLISTLEETSIKLKRLNATIGINPITLDKHKLINKI